MILLKYKYQDSPPGQAGWHRGGERSDPTSVPGWWNQKKKTKKYLRFSLDLIRRINCLAFMQPNHNKIQLISFRKKLRNKATSAEAELWKYLSNRKLAGRKLRT